MFELNSTFANPNTSNGHSNSTSVSKSEPSCFETVEDLGGAGGLAGNSDKDRSQDSVANFEMVKDELDPQFARWGGPMVEAELDSNIAHWREHVDEIKQYKPASDELVDELWDIATSHRRKDGMTYSEEVPREITIREDQCQCGFDPNCGLAPWQNSGSQPNFTVAVETEVENIV